MNTWLVKNSINPYPRYSTGLLVACDKIQKQKILKFALGEKNSMTDKLKSLQCIPVRALWHG